jgi:hypothetical protein
VPGAHRGGHPAYRSALLLDDLLLLDVVLEGTRVGLVAHRGLLRAGRCELLLELAHGLLEARARLVLELLGLADGVQEALLLATQVVEELGLEAGDVLDGDGVELAGGAAQIKAMKDVSGRLKLDLAQFRAMEAFAMFASDLDAASKQQLARGQRLMALLKQPAYSPYAVEDMTVSLWLGTSGRLDDLPVEDVLKFEQEFLDYLRASHAGILSGIRETLKFEDSTESELASAYDSFLPEFQTSGGAFIHAGHEESAPLGDEAIEQAQIVKQKKA